MSGFDVEGTEVGAGCSDGEAKADNEGLEEGDERATLPSSEGFLRN